MRIAEIPGLSGSADVAAIHSISSVEALEEFLKLRGIEARAVEAPDWVQIGTAYDGTAFVEPEPAPEPEPEPAQSITKGDVVAWAEQKLLERIKDIPPTEQTTWSDQLAEAAIVLSGGNAPTPFIDSQSLIMGESRAELATKIQVKAGQLLAYSGVIVGIRRKYLDLIEHGLTEPVFIGSLDLALQQALGG